MPIMNIFDWITHKLLGTVQVSGFLEYEDITIIETKRRADNGETPIYTEYIEEDE